MSMVFSGFIYIFSREYASGIYTHVENIHEQYACPQAVAWII